MNFRKYDIVLALFPFTDLTEAKKRPALVIKELEGENIIVCQITTKRHSFSKYEVPLKKEHSEGDIRFDSYIYFDIIATLNKKVIEKKIGYVKDGKTRKEIDEKLHLILN
ncbi:type II toxin-antitoxin system PemK/MazF family toxin [Candidatus Pacearchaeota archaeon]|nr:type II toxin-antitoxin system PemK/MazF family toxin [Candidatus Pacearchaeota archaeon]